jgi:hypothetical protein
LGKRNRNMQGTGLSALRSYLQLVGAYTYDLPPSLMPGVGTVDV